MKSTENVVHINLEKHIESYIAENNMSPEDIDRWIAMGYEMIDDMNAQKANGKSDLQNYGMFSIAGNRAVTDIVEFAKKNNAQWENVLPMLTNLANGDPENFGEALDTEVREAVYDACNFTSEFYI